MPSRRSEDANPSIGLVLGLTEAFVTPGEPRPSHWNPAWDAGPYQGHPGTGLGRWSVLDHVGLFDESLTLGSDMQWLARARRAGVTIGRIEELCLRYRIHAAGLPKKCSKYREFAAAHASHVRVHVPPLEAGGGMRRIVDAEVDRPGLGPVQRRLRLFRRVRESGREGATSRRVRLLHVQ
jgi:hypothetical protein